MTATGGSSSRPLAAFTALHAFGLLLYGIRYPTGEPIQIAAFASLAWALFQPANRWALITMAALQLALFIAACPVTSNYETVLATIHAAVLVAAATACRLKRSWKPSPEEMLEVLRPLLVLVVAAMYLISVFHKLNSAYFDPENGPIAVVLERMQAQDYPAFLRWYPQFIAALPFSFLAWATLLSEAAIAVAFLVPRWRIGAIAGDFLLHLLLGFRLYPASTNFPSLTLAVCALLLTARFYEQFRFARGVPKSFKPFGIAAAVGILAVMFFDFEGIPGPPLAVRDSFRGALWNLTVIGAAAVFAILAVACRRRRQPCAARFRPLPRSAAGWLLIALFCINGLMPYAGMKSRGCMEMFSGLLVFGGESNHLIIPASWSRAGPGADLVTVLGSDTSAYFDELGDQGATMPYLEFLRIARRKARHGCRFTRRGELVEVRRLADWPDVRDPPFGFLAWRFQAMHWVSGAEFARLRDESPSG